MPLQEGELRSERNALRIVWARMKERPLEERKERKRMPGEPEFNPELPSDEIIEEGRRSSLFLGLIIGGVVVAVGVVAYLLFGKYLVF